MNQTELISVFNRLLRILCRSLPMYLEDAPPWARPEHQPVLEALANVAADQRMMARLVAQTVVEQGGRPDTGPFPAEFTAVNDLGLDFLLQELVLRQRRDVAAIRQCVADLDESPLFRSLAEEALGNARGHLDILTELAQTAGRKPAVGS